ncbi:unnamed protein product [Tilletia controversa]|nr:unnamed protein product [Tilletia controversa]
MAATAMPMAAAAAAAMAMDQDGGGGSSASVGGLAGMLPIRAPELPPETRLLIKVPTGEDLIEFANTHIHNNRVFAHFQHALQYAASFHPDTGIPHPHPAFGSLHIPLPLPRTTDLNGVEHPPSPRTQLRLLEEEAFQPAEEEEEWGQLRPGETEDQWQARHGFSSLTPAAVQIFDSSRKFREERAAQEAAEAQRQQLLDDQLPDDDPQNSFQQTLAYAFGNNTVDDQVGYGGPAEGQAQQQGIASFPSNSSHDPLHFANFYNPAFLGMHPPSSTTMQDEQQAFAFHNQAAQGPMNALQAAIDAATAQAAQSSIDAPQATIDAALPPPPGPPPVAPTTSIPISNQLDYGAADEDDDDSMHDGHHHSRQPAPQQPAVGGALMAAIAASRTHTQYETSSPQNYYVPLSPSLNDTPLPPAVLPEDYEGFELGPSAGADDDDDVVEVPQPTSQPSTSNTKADANANANANAKTNKGLPAKPTPAASTTPANAPWRADERARNFIKAKPVKPDIVEQYYTRKSLQAKILSSSTSSSSSRTNKRRREEADEDAVKKLLLGEVEEEEGESDDESFSVRHTSSAVRFCKQEHKLELATEEAG